MCVELRPLTGPLFIPQMIYEWVNMEQRWNDIDRGKPQESEKNLSGATLSTTDSTWTTLGANQRFHGDKTA
jgi:hypothetical protein